MRDDAKQTLDCSAFNSTFFPLVEIVYPKLGKKGLFKAANEMLRDADNEAPQTPKKEGHLRGARQVEELPGMAVDAGYNSEYAAYQHEAEPGFNYTRKGTILQPGPKFLETPMVQHKDKYIEIVVETIKKGAG